ncbi:MAG: thermonuclease family protein [Hyphomicrobiaceae bacterium]
MARFAALLFPALLFFSITSVIIPTELASEPTAIACKGHAGALRGVTGVVDGETLSLDDGSQVRLVGALSPRAWDGNTAVGTWQPEQDAIAALKTLTTGKSIRLYDLDGQRHDRYGRRLAQVDIITNSENQNENIWLQAEMIKRGHARAYGHPGNLACLSQLQKFETVAQAARIGLWANAAYGVRSAANTNELNRYLATYQLVSGTITGVTKRKRYTYLNFAPGPSGDVKKPAKNKPPGANADTPTPSWRTDFTIYIPRNNIGKEGAAIFSNEIVGKSIIVRGWLENRNGPAIQLHDISQIKFLN